MLKCYSHSSSLDKVDKTTVLDASQLPCLILFNVESSGKTLMEKTFSVNYIRHYLNPRLTEKILVGSIYTLNLFSKNIFVTKYILLTTRLWEEL